MKNQLRNARRQAVTARLESHNVVVEALPSGATRLHGKFGDTITVHDVRALSQREVARLCGLVSCVI